MKNKVDTNSDELSSKIFAKMQEIKKICIDCKTEIGDGKVYLSDISTLEE
jgi:hypothetical protein